MEMEAKRNIFDLADDVLKARQGQDKEAESAATLEFIDHILTGKERDAANLNQTGKRVFQRPRYAWQKFSPSCQTCNSIAMGNLKDWRNDFLPKSETLIGELWGWKAGQIFTDPIGIKATIKGFSQNHASVIVEQEGKEVRLTKQEFSTYKLHVEKMPEPPKEQPQKVEKPKKEPKAPKAIPQPEPRLEPKEPAAKEESTTPPAAETP